MKIIIPARLGSKGLPFKNRTLIRHTLAIIPEDLLSSTWVTTDDSEIIKIAEEYGVNIIDRPSALAEDETSIKDVIIHAYDKIQPKRSDFIVLLYATYPGRRWSDVLSAYLLMIDSNNREMSQSLLCRQEVQSHPYLCLTEDPTNPLFGKQVIQHNLYRRQDYPVCFELSHYISIFRADSIYKLNSNMYCDTTIFYTIPRVIDIDLKKDLDKFNESTSPCNN